MNTLTFEQNQVIFKQGDPASVMYDIVKGSVGVYAAYGTDDEKLLATLGADELLGEMGLIELYPRSATAVALEADTVLTEISEDELSDYFKDKPEKLLKIMRLLSARLRETTQNLVEACRTIYENDEAEKAGKEKSESLWDRLNTYYNMIGIYDNPTML